MSMIERLMTHVEAHTSTMKDDCKNVLHFAANCAVQQVLVNTADPRLAPIIAKQKDCSAADDMPGA